MMMKLCAILIFPAALLFPAAAEVPKNLDNFERPDLFRSLVPIGQKNASFRIVNGRNGKVVQFTAVPGETQWPGGALVAPEGGWDLSKYGRIDAEVYNPNEEKVRVWMRVDDCSGRTRRTQSTTFGDIPPKSSTTIRLYFANNGYGRNYILDTRRISQVFFYLYGMKKSLDLRIDSIRAAGIPGELPAWMPALVKPGNGVLVDFKTGRFDRYVNPRAASVKKEADGTIRAVFRANPPRGVPGVILNKPKQIWNLSDYDQAEFTLRNPGSEAVEVYCQMTNFNNIDPKSGTRITTTLAPGERKTVILPFAGTEIWRSTVQSDGKAKISDAASERVRSAAESGGTGFYSDETFGAVVGPVKTDRQTEIIIEKVVCSVSPPADVPEWVGKRPPVPGKWTLTLEDEFNGDKLQETLWTPRLPWTALQPTELQRYSMKNVFVKDGFLHIRAEKKRGTIYDIPTLPETREYTAGAMTSFDKFSQRYGYFEARVRVCPMVGLWPAFWAMPDHGRQAARKDRRNTVNGGTEIDIFEHPTRLGPFRNNIACHWDGYGANHKKTGNSRIYFRVDREGYVNAGILWEPGKITWYLNGKAVGIWESPAVPSVAIYLKFCVQMGSWGGFIVEDDKLPMDFTVDYVRVWQRDDLAEKNRKDRIPELSPASNSAPRRTGT